MKPDSRDEAVAVMTLVMLALIFLVLIGAGTAAFLSFGDRAGM